ncbi:hypothetical protein BD626DRAFT_450822 [Schizophyllum amplum]|uniref:MYND-type domain-containing protein n=1 Tax=Schizophyllum amplum TaxID=97359 RepID=A0A550CUA7_9AGAR|nr:hypothetical protein BD626DRAFT_450822 [Auriculariopsis ampla]
MDRHGNPITVEQMARNPFLIGKPLFYDIDYVYFPSEKGNNQWIMDTGGNELLELLSNMPHGRPPNVDRKFTYPFVVTNPLSPKGYKLKIQPLIGTADEGVYLRGADIEKLGLRFTGVVVTTRQGDCRVFEGVQFHIPNDYNDGKTKYVTLHIYELPRHLHKAVRSDNSSNSKKHGIIGVSLLAKHVFYLHHGDTHLIGFGVLRESPALSACFLTMRPICGLGMHKPRSQAENPRLSLGRPFPGRALDIVLAMADRCRPQPPFSAFDAHRLNRPVTYPVMNLPEMCRVCEKEDAHEGVKLEFCTRCVQERRPQRALYCSQACQRADWKERHKAEHTGERPWDVTDRVTRDSTTADGQRALPVYAAGY